MNDMRAFLGSVYEARLELGRMSSKAQSLYESATRVTGATDAQHSGAGADRDALLAAYAEANADALARERRYLRQIRRVSDFIDSVEDGRYRMILRYRYLELMPWRRITALMSLQGNRDEPYTERHILRLHGEALNAAREAWKKYNKEDYGNGVHT